MQKSLKILPNISSTSTFPTQAAQQQQQYAQQPQQQQQEAQQQEAEFSFNTSPSFNTSTTPLYNYGSSDPSSLSGPYGPGEYFTSYSTPPPSTNRRRGP